MRERVIRIGDVEVIDTPNAAAERAGAGTPRGMLRPRLAAIAALLLRTLIVAARLLIVTALTLGRVVGAELQAALRGLDRASGRESDSQNGRYRDGA